MSPRLNNLQADSYQKMMHCRKTLICGVAFLVLLSTLPVSLLQSSFAQFTGDTLTIEISRSGQAQVTAEITARTTVSRINVQAIASNVSNILAVDENNIVLSTSYDASGPTMTIDTLGSSHVTLTYTAQIVTKVSSDMWEVFYGSSEIQSTIILPSGSEIIYVNNIPIDIIENMVTMPSEEEITMRYKIKDVAPGNFVASWEDTDYVVQIVTISRIFDFNFEQSSKAITLTLDAGAPVLVIIPKTLLGGPYTVQGSDSSPITFRHYYQNSTHSWLRIEPSDTDTIKIVGTTVVPEFIFLIAFPLAMASAVIVLVILRQKTMS